MTLVRLRLRLDDEPGRLALVAAEIASQRGNILSLGVLHDVEDNGSGVVDDLVVQLPADVDTAAMAQRLRACGCRDVGYQTVEARTLVDAPTRMLDLAARLAERPETLTAILADLLCADDVIVHEPGTAPAAADDDASARNTVTLTLDDGRIAQLRRHWPTFTLTEEARAFALLRLAGAQSDVAARTEHVTERRIWTIMLADGEEVTVRAARSEDAFELHTMHQRCSRDSLRRRYGNPAPELNSRRLRTLVTDDAIRTTLVALDADGQLIGHGQLSGVSADTGDLTLLVEDVYQGKGIGTALARRLVASARDRGMQRMRAWTQPDNWSFFCALLRAKLALEVTHDGGRVLLSAPVPNRLTPPAVADAPPAGGASARAKANRRANRDARMRAAGGPGLGGTSFTGTSPAHTGH